MASFPMLLGMLRQVLILPSLEKGLTKHPLVHDRQRTSDNLLVAICTTPIHRFMVRMEQDLAGRSKVVIILNMDDFL